MSEKKDVLEFPLEELEVPAAIKLMMQAATSRPTVDATCDEQENTYIKVDDERLLELSEKLEARIEDAIDAAKTEPVAEDAPDEEYTVQEVEGHEVTFSKEEYQGDPIITRVVVDGAIFVLTCNARVYRDPDIGLETNCIKEFGHKGIVHEDTYGNEAP